MSKLVVHPIPTDLESQPDPYRWLDAMREAGPVHRVDLRGGLEGWLVTRYDDVAVALADPRLSSDPTTALEVFEELDRRLTPMRERYEALMDPGSQLDKLLAEGAAQARDRAAPVLKAVRKATGI